MPVLVKSNSSPGVTLHSGSAGSARMRGPTPGTRVKGRVLYLRQPPPMHPPSLGARACGTSAAYARGVSVPLSAGGLAIHDNEAWRQRSTLRRTNRDAHKLADESREWTGTRATTAFDGGGLSYYHLYRPARAEAAQLPATGTTPASVRGSRRAQPVPLRPDLWLPQQDVRTRGHARAVTTLSDRAAGNARRATTPVQSHPYQRRLRVEAGDADNEPRATTNGRAGGLSTGGWSTDASTDGGHPGDTVKDNRAVLRRMALWEAPPLHFMHSTSHREVCNGLLIQEYATAFLEMSTVQGPTERAAAEEQAAAEQAEQEAEQEALREAQLALSAVVL